MMFALVRTGGDGRPQSGISFLLIDLGSPGVTVRSVATIDGEPHLNEIFLDEVRVPVENRVGEEGGGWTYAKFLLGNERLLAAEIGKAHRLMAQLSGFLRDGFTGDPTWRRRVAGLEARILGLESLSYDLLAQAEAGRDPGAMASVLKLVGSDLIQAITSAMMDALGPHGLSLPGEDDVLPEGGSGAIAEYLYDRAATIYGGSSEIQRNIIAKAVLGL
jgi:alkylation response protein AidB-like acyl-CoA dehydrogenase